jgi:orc1/cdc6 family replication initiation protein
MMIEDARVLRDEFVPREVEHRDSEVNHLASVLAPIMDGQPADTALITGSTGTGKTCIAQFTVGRLRRAHLDVEYQYVNCWQNYSRFKVLYSILEDLGKTIDIHRQSTPRDELIDRLRQYDGPPCVVILDEADQLEDKSVFYDLHALSGFSMLLIANDDEAMFAGADERLRSRIRGSEHIHFDRYTVEELTAILDARAKRGLEPGAIDRSELQTIADAAAGDARVAISILRSAARQAQRETADRITADLVQSSIPTARSEVRRKALDTLTPHQRTLYKIVEDHGEIEPSALYDAYRERVDDPKTNRTVRNYLQKMAHYDLLVAEGTSRDRTYHL